MRNSFLSIFCFAFLLGIIWILSKNEPKTEVFVTQETRTGDSTNLASSSYEESLVSPESVSKFVMQPNSITYNDIVSLGSELTFKERNFLYKWLLLAETSRTGLFFKDALLNKLERQSELPQEYIAELLKMFKKSDLDSDFRGYLLQHLRLNYSASSEKEQQEIYELMILGLAEVNSEVAGTALAAISQLSIDQEITFPSQINLAISTMLLSGNVRSQTTAAAVCGAQKIVDLAPIIRMMVIEDRMNKAVKLAAIGALARINLPEDRELLLSFKDIDNGFYRSVLESYENN